LLGWSVQSGHSFSGEGLGEADGIAAGLADVGMVQQPVNGGGREGFGHELIEAGGVEVGADRDGALFVCCVDDPVEAFGSVRGHRQQTNIVNHHQLRAEDSGDGPGDAVIGAVCPDQDAEVLKPEPGRAHPRFDGLLAEGFEEGGFPVPEGPQTTRFSLRLIHSKVRRACWVGPGMEEASGSQASKVFPVGKPAALRREASMDRAGRRLPR
jgi:hypothetical protein